MRPVDTDELQRDIKQRVAKRDEIEEELEEIDQLKTHLPALEKDRTRLETEIEDVRDELAEIEAELEAQDISVEQTREEKTELEDRLADLRSKRAELEEIRYEFDTERESIESTQNQLREIKRDLEDLPETPIGEIEELEAKIDRLRNEKQRVERDVTELQGVIQFNQEMLEETSTELLDEDATPSGSSVTDELVADKSVTCWTCGSETSKEQIETTISRLQEVSEEQLENVNEIEADLNEHNDRIQTLREQQQRREQLQRRQSNFEANLIQGEKRLEELTDRTQL